jgi:DNA primase catalytic core
MPNSQDFDRRREVIQNLTEGTDLVQVAHWLGLSVVQRSTATPLSLCPFHEDHKPSLRLYNRAPGSRPHYHCFACGAHGDVFDLIKKLHNTGFQGALEWLCQRSGIALPEWKPSNRRQAAEPKSRGFDAALKLFKNQSAREEAAMHNWAMRRGFEPEFLTEVEVLAVYPPKISSNTSILDRETIDALESAGVLRRATLISTPRNPALPMELPLRDFFSTPRILFVLRDGHARVVGFAGRALEAESPKYLYTPGFARGATLYRFHRIRAKPMDFVVDRVLHLFVVEGLMDCLRLESLGLCAVALLGSSLTSDQASLLKALADELEPSDVQLAVHLFLDADEPGRRGSDAALVKLLETAISSPGLLVDAINPPSLDGTSQLELKRDPDDLLQECVGRQEALVTLASWCDAPLKVLLAHALEVSPSALESTWQQTQPNQRVRAFREIERRLDRESWIAVFDRVTPSERYLGEPEPEGEAWVEALSAFLRGSQSKLPSNPVLWPAADVDDQARLLRALQIAEASTQRRELPVDQGSWDRLQAAADILLPSLCEQLTMADDPWKFDKEPFLAVHIPKADGKLRLKALPSPERLTLQQYVLNELLRDYSDSPRVRLRIPAVRYNTTSKKGSIVTTGMENVLPANGETVSFAYMVDMDVVEHRTPPQRTGMFRHYYDCWSNFISFVDNRVSRCPFEHFHVARLDVRAFYDSLPRAAVNNVLLPAVTEALGELASSEDQGARLCAPLFLPKTVASDARAQAIVDWLCDESFHFQYEDPVTASLQVQSKGVPQGPDLSAYLANIALFPLDRAISRIVDELDRSFRESPASTDCGGVYARYVDDMVVIAPTAHDLARMRMAIEQELGKLGLELSPKTEPLPVMNGGQVRNWLTERRGAGLGVSGPFAGPPVNEPLAALEPLVGAEQIDRDDSLLILHDPRLDDPDTPISEIETAILAARQASELRHGDESLAARHLWRCVLDSSGEAHLDVSSAAKEFEGVWNRVNVSRSGVSSDDPKDGTRVKTLLAWLDGIERLLHSRHDRNPRFSEAKHEQVLRQRQRMARLVHHGLGETLIRRFYDNPTDRDHFSMFEIRALAIRRAACAVVPMPADVDIPNGIVKSRARARLIISIAELAGRSEFLDRAGLRDPGIPPEILIHEAIARLRIANREPLTPEGSPVSPAIDPLMPMSESVERLSAHPGSVLHRILSLWMPNPRVEVAGDEFAKVALFGLMNLASKHAPELLAKRPILANFALRGQTSDTRNVSLLPPPPGAGVAGLVGLVEGDKIVLRANFENHEDAQFDPHLDWKSTTSTQGWMRAEASLQPYEYLNVPSIPLNQSNVARWLAAAFRSLVTAGDQRVEGVTCPPTALNLLGPSLDCFTSESRWGVLGYMVSQRRVRGQAFVRHGDGGLIPEPVPDQWDHLWRVGVALADWLGELHGSRSLSTLRLCAPALVSSSGADWATEAMLRACLCRLRGKSLRFARPLRVSPKTGLPLTIERVLSRLECFPNDSADGAGLGHLVAALGAGRALESRLGIKFDPQVPGGAVALLVDLARPQFRSDEEMATRLPLGDTVPPKWFPVRRPARAWVAFAQRLGRLLKVDGEKSEDITLAALVAGTALLGIESQLRAQALELWSVIEPGRRTGLLKSYSSISVWNLDLTALLHREQKEPIESDATGQIDAPNVRFLFQQILHATRGDKPISWDALSGVTPLGWLVLIGTLVGALPGQWRGCGLHKLSELGPQGLAPFSAIAMRLAIPATDEEDPPWGGMDNAIMAWTENAIQETFDFLERLDAAAELKVSTQTGHRFRLEGSRKGAAEVETSDGLREIPCWAISWAKTQDESQGGVERLPATSYEQRAIFRWTETWHRQRVIGIGVVQPGLVALAGGGFIGDEAETIEALNPEAHPSECSMDLASHSPPVVETQEKAISLTEPLNRTIGRQPIIFESAPKANSSAKPQSAIQGLRELQERSWSARGKSRALGHVRIAIFQWEVDSSYLHPLFEACDFDSEVARSLAKEKPEKWTEHADVRSCAEYRRRALLTEVLKACNRFKVDILLLPEYSTRPETILWIKSRLSELAPATSVWAGTYRLPPGMNASPLQDPVEGWSAILPVVLSRDPTRPRYRAKKYPSIAAEEIFHPGSHPITPLFHEQIEANEANACSHVIELICSEIFLISSPTNLLPLARVRSQLLSKFGVSQASQIDQLNQVIFEDIKSFATATSLGERLGPRRSIVLVPAMTSRSADFTGLGQAGFLASGLTTVFCNAVAGDHGHGHSCFIGHNGWLGAPCLDVFPRLGPYHGICPGIFHFEQPDKGRLGRNEQSLVIADVDPIYAFEGKPRPETLLHPLQLVAHLPVIESWALKNGADAKRCRCNRVDHQQPPELCQRLLTALEHGKNANYQNTMQDDNPKMLGAALHDLAKCSSHKNNWMTERATAYFNRHSSDPQPWPPPVAVDWMWVDLGAPGEATSSQIEAPAYCSPAG